MRECWSWDAVKPLNQSKNVLHLGVEHVGLEPKLSPPATQKPWCGDSYCSDVAHAKIIVELLYAYFSRVYYFNTTTPHT